MKNNITPSKNKNGNTNNLNNNNSNNNSNIILHNPPVGCFNNINIYASNMNNFKASDLNLRHYIFNKMNGKKVVKQNEKSARSNSYISHV